MSDTVERRPMSAWGLFQVLENFASDHVASSTLSMRWLAAQAREWGHVARIVYNGEWAKPGDDETAEIKKQIEAFRKAEIEEEIIRLRRAIDDLTEESNRL